MHVVHRVSRVTVAIAAAFIFSACSPTSERDPASQSNPPETNPGTSEPQSPSTPSDPPADASPPPSAPADVPREPLPHGAEICDGRNGTPTMALDSWESLAQRRAAAAIDCDAQEVMTRIWTLALRADETDSLLERVRQLRSLALDAVRAGPVQTSRLPLSASHQQMYQVAAEAERKSGSAAIRAWSTNPWRPMNPLDEPEPSGDGELVSAVMRGERRALTFNLRNSSDEPQIVRIQVEMPGIPAVALNLSRVNWTGNDRSNWTAAELEPLGDAREPRETMLLPGITQQIWIDAHADISSGAGTFLGRVAVSSGAHGTTSIPIAITVFKTRFPERPTMHLAGWDWADGAEDERYGVTAANRAQYIELLRSRHVDMPWGHRRVMMFSTSPLKVSAMRSWLAAWPDARRYRIFLHTTSGFGDLAPTDASFSEAVQTWARAWADEIRQNGKQPEQFDLLLLDEPRTVEKAETTELWARAIRASGASFKIWTDPIWSDPLVTPQGLIDAADTIAISLGVAERTGAAYWDWARQLQTRGKNVEIYACEGPARRLDPYFYYRLISWRAFFIGAKAVSFWSFASLGKSPSDNEFAVGSDPRHPVNYSPLFINGDQIRTGKHMEAAAFGIQDAEYLRLVQEVAQAHANASVRERAMHLIREAEAFVSAAPPLSLAQWRTQPENTEADRHRIELGSFLDTLAH